MLNGTLLGGQNIRLSWGRSPANKQVEYVVHIPNQSLFLLFFYGQGIINIFFLFFVCF